MVYDCFLASNVKGTLVFVTVLEVRRGRKCFGFVLYVTSNVKETIVCWHPGTSESKGNVWRSMHLGLQKLRKPAGSICFAAS